MEQRIRKICIRHYTPETTLKDYMYQERREEENLPALKSESTLVYNDSRKNTKERLITAIKNDTDNTMTNRMTITRKQKCEDNNSMGALNVK